MERLLQTLIIGVDTGAIYALIALGMVLVYRTTGVLNIAHGGVGVLVGFIAWDLITLRGWPYYAGVTVGILVAIALGVAFEFLVIRRLAGRPDLQTVSTLGLFLLTQSVVFLVPWWGNTWGQLFPSPLLGKNVRVPVANYAVSWDTIVLLLVGVTIFAALYYMLKRTRLGMAMRAVADDAGAARIMGVQPYRVSMFVWGLAFGLSGLTTMLVAPIVFLDNTSLTSLTLKALVVTFIGGLVSLPLTVFGAMLLGLLEAYSQIYAPNAEGLSDAWPFILLLVVLTLRFARGGGKSTFSDGATVRA
ncbi:MAG TPA: branched-chain amino acid ABC transporter permease [Sporichthya sp.]|nr:branched-chain amino acid ABC transporter permease [Sporichthya sp.]